MHRLSVAVLLLLTACGTREIGKDSGFRIPNAPIYSNAALDLNRLEGRWDQVATFKNSPDVDCKLGGAEFRRTQTTVHLTYRLCLSGRNAVGDGEVVATGPGRFSITGKDSLGQDWWVLWVDEGYRTMAIGTPSGAFGFILNRGVDLPTDRLAAASEVFDFNGYRTDSLKLSGH